mmetsp:Transcript_31265/g.34153  ORF Transcript_31265/g.34153 Transcript_31265/m.34153 type:complete len:108 (+) Transcript_31265:113-436(+)
MQHYSLLGLLLVLGGVLVARSFPVRTHMVSTCNMYVKLLPKSAFTSLNKPDFSFALSAESRFKQDEEFFESEFDRKPLKDRLPVAFAVLAGVSLPFVIGLIFLALNK